MKVYYIGSGYDGCYYVRCMLPLIANKWKGQRNSLSGAIDTPMESAKHCLESDVVVFQRPMEESKLDLAKKLKSVGKKIVMDNDDTYRKDHGIPQTEIFKGHGGVLVDRYIEQINNNLVEFSKIADLVTVSTDFLAEEYKAYNNNVKVLPNCVNIEDWKFEQLKKGDKVRIGLVGSVAGNKDYEVIKPLLKELSVDDRVQLVLFALPPKSEEYEKQRKFYSEEIEFWDSLNVEWQPTVHMSEYIKTLHGLNLDIMLIPRHDNLFNRCKSNIKYLEASMLKIATIAQGFDDGNSPYQKDVVNGVNGYICQTIDEWRKCVELLISNKQHREELAENAHKYVINNYDIHKKSQMWIEAYK